MSYDFRRKAALILLAATLLLCGCGAGKTAKHADLAALYEQIVALPDAPEMLPISEKRMLNYYGIDAGVCPQAFLARCSDGLRVDEFWLVEAENEEAAKALVTLAEARIEQLCAETENYLPEQYAVVKEGKIVRIGSTMGLFISPQANRMEELFRAAFR